MFEGKSDKIYINIYISTKRIFMEKKIIYWLKMKQSLL